MVATVYERDNSDANRSPNAMTVLGSGFHAVDSGLYLLDLDSLSVERGFWTTIISVIPESLSWIADYKAQDYGLHKAIVVSYFKP